MYHILSQYMFYIVMQSHIMLCHVMTRAVLLSQGNRDDGTLQHEDKMELNPISILRP